MVKLAENNKIEEIKLKMSKIYSIKGLSIDQDLQSNICLPTIEGRNTPRNVLRVYAEEERSFNPDLKIYKEGYFDIIIPFKKRSDVLVNGFQYYDRTTQKQETIEFCDYNYHLKSFILCFVKHKSVKIFYIHVM